MKGHILQLLWKLATSTFSPTTKVQVSHIDILEYVSSPTFITVAHSFEYLKNLRIVPIDKTSENDVEHTFNKYFGSEDFLTTKVEHDKLIMAFIAKKIV